jgi:ABC-type transport system involved in multi-copper enzyme maturation permease subunit
LKGSRENPGGTTTLGNPGKNALIWYMVLAILMACCLIAKERNVTLVCLAILFGLFINAFVRIFGVGTTIRETQVVIVEGYKSVNDCVGPFTQIDYEVLDFDFDQAVSKTY